MPSILQSHSATHLGLIILIVNGSESTGRFHTVQEFGGRRVAAHVIAQITAWISSLTPKGTTGRFHPNCPIFLIGMLI